ncbi:phytanoyl-CoA dioxygenase family protein [Erythrobacter sp.]|uniref:phytanoyl-CoA dioxygenase family protein n=1 Tax=Erythrobacter sp. TaxID=1042 RepID=UPI0025E24636|nr:phytanoyl-CoA dioxygenase family protein [Erythrobacter sp.]
MKNPLPGLPLIESPLFPVLLPELGLNAEEVRIGLELHERGYAVFDFPDQDLVARIERIQASLGPRFGVDFADPASDKTAGDRRIQDAWEFDVDVRAIASNSGVLELLSKLYGRGAFPFQTLNFPVGTQQGAHTDIVHFSSQPEKFMCGVWLAMEDIVAEAGPLFYFPGSHRWPVMSNALVGRKGFGGTLASAQDPFEAAWAAIGRAKGATAETFMARKGQALIWCANLLHGGSPQTDPRLTRWSQVTHYYFDDCIYYTPAFSDEAIGALDWRHITAISDGQRRPNLYHGEPVADLMTRLRGKPASDPEGGWSVRRMVQRMLSRRR